MDLEQLKKAANSGIAPFGVTTYRNIQRVFGIKQDDRRRHVYLVGKTGMGKTTLIENMVYSDIIAGHGVCYIDPHGDTAEKMLQWIPSDRINDVIYFNPSDLDYPISFNVLEKVDPKVRHLVSSGLIGVFKKLWADSWGPRLEYILRNAILALLEYPDSTLLGINRMLVDKVYRKKVVDKITDPVVRSFWVDEFPKWNERVLQEVISPIQNKVGQFLSTSLIRNIVGQVKSSIDLRSAMDDGKILILNLSKGRVGEDASALFGAMMVTKLYLAAMSRVDISEDERKDFYLYVDEFQNFATDSFKDILSEARKYKLNLIIAHQYIEQLGEVVQPAVFGNVGTIICFRVGAQDGEFLEKEFTPHLTQEDLVNLPKFHIYLKLMIDGIASEPFSAKGLPPVFGDSTGNEEKVINVSRERYAKPREVVEDKIRRWSLSEEDKKKEDQQQQQESKDHPGITVDLNKKDQNFKDRSANKPKNKDKKKNEKKKDGKTGFPTNCASCNKDIEVPFMPDGVRPVFCKDCLKKARRGDIPLNPSKKAEKPSVPEVKESEPAPVVSLDKISDKTVDFKGQKAKKKQDLKLKEDDRPPVPKIPEPVPIPEKPGTHLVQRQPKPSVKPKEEERPVSQDKSKAEQPVSQAESLPEKEPEKSKPLPQADFMSQDDKKNEESTQPTPSPSADLLSEQSNVKEGDVVEL